MKFIVTKGQTPRGGVINLRSACEEILRLLWKKKVPYCVRKNPRSVPVVTQKNLIRTVRVHFSKSSPSAFQTKRCAYFVILTSALHALPISRILI